MTASHTSGPWNIYSWDKNTKMGVRPVDSTKSDICSITTHVDCSDRSLDEAYANARLIESAPEMLSVIETILFQINQGSIFERDACIAEARKIYKKVKGKHDQSQ